MVTQRRYITLLFALLLLGGMVNKAWAAKIKVTYHILTLPMDNTKHHTLAAVDGKRVEALRYIEEGEAPLKVRLPDHFKSPLAKDFIYHPSADVTKSGAREKIYEYMTTTYDTYTVTSANHYTEGTSTVDTNCDIYVTYTYNASNGIVKLDGTQDYNIKLGDRFLAFNKDRANRPAAIHKNNVSEENLISDNFTYVATPGFNGNKHHNFHFRFILEGEDPYNITLRSSYNGDETFLEADKALNKTVKKWYKGASLFCQGKDNGGNNLWLASDDHKQYTQTDPNGEVTSVDISGFFRGGNGGTAEMNPIWNAFAFLNASEGTGYVFMASKVNTNGNSWQPKNGQYFYLTGSFDSGNNPRFQLKTPTLAEKTDEEIYEIREYTYKVKTPLSNTIMTATVKFTEFINTASLMTHIPDALKRKYATFVGAYSDEALTNEISTFADADAANNSRVIWLKYTSTLPFESLSAGGSYEEARWYTLRMNGVNENQYVVTYDKTNDRFNTGGGSNSDIHQGENSAEAQFAFIGDPFELKIISRSASETAETNKYVGCATAAADATLFSSQTGTSDISSWEIVADNVSGAMILRELGSHAAPKYIGWKYGEENNPIYYKTTASYIKVVELDKKDYVYYIVRNDAGDIAVKATQAEDVGTPLKFSKIPEIIRSPFIGYPGVTISYYWTLDDAKAKSNVKKHAQYDLSTNGNKIYVRYDMGSVLGSTIGSAKIPKLDNTEFYNVRLNGQFLYYSDGSIKSKATITNEEAAADAYLWSLEGSDPYNMIIQNKGAAQYIKTTFAEGSPLTFDIQENASKFIAKSSTVTGIYEVMAATGGGDNDPDASTEYYNIGRNADNDVRMYSNTTYAHGYNQIRFLLTNSEAVIYHLVDKSKTDLLQVRSRRSDLFFPADYRSPLVSNYHYYAIKADADAGNNEISSLTSATETVDGMKQIYVTYDTNDLINLQNGVMYLLKFEAGDSFRQENGSDGLTTSAVPAVYPYCNGDCNFFVYGNDEYELQQQGAASTRTRWAWYVESTNNDPYHVKICSRQTETFNSSENRGYFRTCVETFGGTKHVVTTLAWPGITGVAATEYMILGSVGQYQLVTTDPLNDGTSDERRTVKSFEQYWKTFDTIRKKIFGDNVSNNDILVTDPSTVPATPLFTVTTEASKDNNRTYLEEVMNFHSYSHWAYAKRWNGFNISGAKSKGWEEIEHWYQTVNMGEGHFDFKPISIEPALILLDQHGWEIMRKPLPSSPDDPTKAAKYDAIRPYNSPMVKEYYFWGSAKKRSGFHQYYQLSGQVKVDGKVYTSTDLTKLPDYYNSDGTRNSTIFDKKGNQLDEYVTYVAKDEYVQSYNPTSGEGQKYIIQQGNKYASATNTTTVTTKDVPTTGGMSEEIIKVNASFNDADLWYLKPNTDIDNEMGYGGYVHDWTNDYTGSTATSGFNSNGFDPYNIQITNAANPDSYFVTDATTAGLDDGSIFGNGTTVSLGAKKSATGSWHDSRTLALTNATFMVVQDATGNMQLMPRFDHNRRIRNFSTLVTPTEEASDENKLPETYTKLFRPMIYNYHIIDNSGNESLRYQSGGDLLPQIPAHFRSPFAKDFTFYKEQDCTNEITESFAKAGKTETTNDIYVRYAFDEESDTKDIMKGKWFTMQLNTKDTKFADGIKQGDSKPDPVDGDDKAWQWKFLETPQTTPDPYAVYIYNRSQSAGTKADASRFALLSHTSGDYALAEAGTGTYNYTFLNGSSMSNSTAATTTAEAGFKGTSCTFSGTDSQVKLLDDVEHTYLYKIYTNSGAFAVSDTQSQAEASINAFVPELPETIRTPLLNAEDFIFYESQAYMGNADKELHYLYGLYEDEVYVRYKTYSELKTTFKVPNSKEVVDGHAARKSDSNDASLALGGNLLYNIIWYNDNMMKSNGTAIECTANQDLQAADTYEWTLDGNDPYAIKIKNKANKYIYNSSENSCILDDNATTFMLLSQDGYDYGVLQVTGDANKRKLTGYGNALTADATTAPTQYIIFALATFSVTYHLVINNIAPDKNNPKETNYYTDIPYRPGNENSPETLTTETIYGSTQRDLSNYPIADVTIEHVSLGDVLKVPESMERPNCNYFFYIDHIEHLDGTWKDDDTMNEIYKGLVMTEMGRNQSLLGKKVFVNIVYRFNTGLETNSGNDFVKYVSDNKWYTFETKDNSGTPWLAQYTNAWGLEVKAGRGSHYTNDYLWAPVGDPYGFKFYNRYIYKNSGDSNIGEPTKVMTTTTGFSDGQVLSKGENTDPNSVYELLISNSEGYFWIHPVVNNTGPKYYFKTVDDGNGIHVKLGTTPTEFTFGLSKELMKPYFDRVGYVGGLKKSVYDDAANTNIVNAMKNESAVLTFEQLMDAQTLVYNDENIVAFTSGYYRLHSPEGIEGIDTRRYASGYTHAIEKDLNNDGDEADAIPMHFYEQEGVSTTFENLSSGGVLNKGFTNTPATRGELPIPAVEYDPASIFYITGAADNAKMCTQGLYVKGMTSPDVAEGDGVRANAVMTATEGSASSLWIMDIGGAVMLIHDRTVPANRKYFCYDQTDANHIYDLKLTHNTHTDHAKWCLQPANNLGLRITTHNGGDEEKYGTSRNYASFYAPFDILLPNDGDEKLENENYIRQYKAYICDNVNSPWNTSSAKFDLYPKAIGHYNTGTYAGNNKFVPAGTPVLLAMYDQTGYVKVTIPTTSPSASLKDGITYTFGEASPVACNNILSGEYLEKKLTSGNDVYTFGMPINAQTINKANDFASTGNIDAVLPSQSNSGLGFYLNANPNRELGGSRGDWTRNNWYVYGNKVYYRSTGAGAREKTRGVEFIPVVFDENFEEEDGVLEDNSNKRFADGVYDLQGRRVASDQMVKDGTWKQNLAPGIYIVNGKKIRL